MKHEDNNIVIKMDLIFKILQLASDSTTLYLLPTALLLATEPLASLPSI